MENKEDTKTAFLKDPLFQEVLAEALAIQDRFSAEPVYAKKGVGYLKSTGVKELQEIKKQNQPSPKSSE